VLILMQDRCTGCVERTICSEINEECHMEFYFPLFGDSVSFAAR